ncbi:hypothetical protein NDA14_006399 [Ustilago hordei]|nr:hypothetical protein NDA14_006399 [Ustilago hordei]
MDPEKVRTVKEWPMPESIHDIQRFLGFANFYQRFIAHFARIAKPLTSLVKPIEWFKKFELPEEAQQAFHKLIQAFTSAGVLQHFDYHLPTRLETDASDFAIAGVLKQEHEGRWHPVAFYSRKMSSAEKNYEIHDKELLAYRPGDKGGEPDALTRRTDMQPAGEEQDHNVRQLLPPRVFKETADHDSTLVAPMLSMESIASKGLKDLVKIFQPLDQELQEIHMKKPFELKDDLWYSGGRLVIPKVTMPGRTNNRHSRSAKEVDGQSLSVEHLQFMQVVLYVLGTKCHGPGCSRSRRVTGSYGRSTGIEDLVEISREHGRSAVSMETMDSYGLTCKGGPSTATRRTKLKEQAQPRRGPSSRSMQMVTTQGLERQEPKELSLIKGGGAVSKESTSAQEAQGCQAGEAPEQYSMKKVLSGEREQEQHRWRC